jgi:RHS repeat-associated protein
VELGGAQAGLGYAGEWWDEGLEMQYLRARWYDVQVGRFTLEDPWEGNYKRPSTLNGWNYVESNPVNHTDPIGYGICLSLVGTQQWTPFLTVGQAIAMCQELFDKNNWELTSVDCSGRCAQRWSSPETIVDLGLDYLCECGPEHVFFDGNHPLTVELARSVLLDSIRKEFYAEGSVEGHLDFGVPQFLLAWLDAAHSMSSRLEFIPITHWMGSFKYRVHSAGFGRVGFWIHNQTDLASGTHFAGRFWPEYYETLEELVEQNPQLADEPLSRILDESSGYHVIAILEAKTREQTIGSEGGGVMEQTFTWTEEKLGCWQRMFPWPVHLLYLDIREWSAMYSR